MTGQQLMNMQILFLATIFISVITVALLIRAVMLKNWSALQFALVLMLAGGVAGYFMAEQNHAGQFTERLSGITIPEAFIYTYLSIVLFGLISFIITAFKKK